MSLFVYRCVNQDGKKRNGKIEAPNLKQATTQLQSQGLFITSIHSSREKLGTSTGKDKKFKRSSVPGSIITAFTRQLSILVDTGIPYDKAFEILIEECTHTIFMNILSSMKAQIIEGGTLAGSLSTQPKLFPKMYVAMVRAGEAGGTLAKVLEQLAIHRESGEALRHKVQGAMIYPAIMVVMGMGIVTFMMSFIIPKIIPIFQQFDVELPLPTRIVLVLSDFITGSWLLIIIVISALLFALQQYIKTKKGEYLRDLLILKIPVLGKVLRKLVVFRFTQSMGTMLTSGVDLKQSLDIVKHVMGNRVYEDKFDQLSQDITKKGMHFSQGLRVSGLFPVTVIQMIRVGEESGQLEAMLDKISSTLEKEVSQTVEKAIAVLEPVMIMWMSLMVGFIVLAVMLPMFEMNQLL